MPTVIASSFADPKDVVAYLAAIKRGLPRSEATSDAKAMCALPPEEWKAKWGIGSAARGKKVSVTYRGKTVIGELRDTMPHKPKITNGAGKLEHPAGSGLVATRLRKIGVRCKLPVFYSQKVHSG